LEKTKAHRREKREHIKQILLDWNNELKKFLADAQFCLMTETFEPGTDMKDGQTTNIPADFNEWVQGNYYNNFAYHIRCGHGSELQGNSERYYCSGALPYCCDHPSTVTVDSISYQRGICWKDKTPPQCNSGTTSSGNMEFRDINKPLCDLNRAQFRHKEIWSKLKLMYEKLEAYKTCVAKHGVALTVAEQKDSKILHETTVQNPVDDEGEVDPSKLEVKETKDGEAVVSDIQE